MQNEALLLFFVLLYITFANPRKTATTLVIDLNGDSINDNERHPYQRSCVLRQHGKTKYWELLNHKNGVDEGTNFDLKFSCGEGYSLSSSNPYSMCDNYWNTSVIPTCAKICPPLNSTSSTILKCFNKGHKEIGCNEAVNGSYVSVTCAPYYESPTGVNATILCSEGRWESRNFTCEPACGRKIRRNTTSSQDENSVEEYPWIAGIYRRESNSIMNTCGGTLISDRLLLTAAHCVSDSEGNALPPKKILVKVGALYAMYKDPRDREAQYSDVIQIVNQPRYQGVSFYYANDIAVLVTRDQFVFNDFVQPVCIIGVNNFNLKSGDVGIVIGWGIIKPGNEPSDRLRLLEIPYKPQSTCLNEIPKDWREQFDTVDKLCAGLYNQNRSTCLGDGGAGLTYKNSKDDKYYIHGIVSLGHAIRGKCNIQQNTLYTNVSYHKDFVYNEMNNYVVVDCALPPYPDNGTWTVESKYKKPGDIVPSDTFLLVSCNDGFKLNSDEARIRCDSLFMPKCEKLCPPQPKSSASVKCFNKDQKPISCDEATDGSTLTYSCPPLYRPPFGVDTTIRCQKGEWDSPGPQCNSICGQKVSDDVIPLLFGAKETKVIEYPWVAAVYKTIKQETYENVCGGSIISHKIVVTAAHCVTNAYGDPLSAETFEVGVGKLYNKYLDPRDPKPQYLKVSNVLPHENYRAASRNFMADIALLVTRETLIFNHFVHPVCFTGIKQITLKTGNVGVVTGWGVTENNRPSDELRQLEIPYKHRHVCAKELPAEWQDKYNLIDKLCAGLYNQNKSVCRGDSGGGLFYKNSEDGRYYVHGIVSLGVGKMGKCDHLQNTLYTDVSFHYDFIYSKLSRFVEDCQLPPYPENGKWIIPNDDKKPGDMVSADTILKYSCDEGFTLSSYLASTACKSMVTKPSCLNITEEENTKQSSFKVTCVYDGKLNDTSVTLEEFNTTLCDHVIFNSIELNRDGRLKIPANLSIQSAAVILKENKRSLKVLLTIYGTGRRASDEFPVVAGNESTRAIFIASVVDFLDKYNYDGVNVHWDVPMPNDTVNYGLLVSELSKKLKPRGWLTTATVFRESTNLGYNHTEMYNNLDWINVECYNRPFSNESELDIAIYYICVENWLSHSYNDKLSIGLAFFGRHFTKADVTETELQNSPDNVKFDHDQPDIITYQEICRKYSKLEQVWYEVLEIPYIHNGTKWISYENVYSISVKAGHIEKNNFFGATVFPVNGDDLRGECGRKQHLLEEVQAALHGHVRQQLFFRPRFENDDNWIPLI